MKQCFETCRLLWQNTQIFTRNQLFKFNFMHMNKHFTVSFYHVRYAFQSESIFYNSCLTIKELLAWNRHNIWSLSDSNWSVWLNGWAFVCELSGCGFESCCSHLCTSLLLLKLLNFIWARSSSLPFKEVKQVIIPTTRDI